MIGTVLGLAGGVGNMIAGGIKTAKANRERRKILEDERKRIQSQYDSEYYQDYLDRSDIQSLIKKLRDDSQERLQNAESSAVITGATPESVAAQKKAEAEGLGKSLSQIAGYGDGWKQSIADRYNQQMASLRNMGYQFNAERSANYSNMLSNAANAITGAASSVSGLVKDPQEDILNKELERSKAVMSAASSDILDKKIKIPNAFGG